MKRLVEGLVSGSFRQYKDAPHWLDVSYGREIGQMVRNGFRDREASHTGFGCLLCDTIWVYRYPNKKNKR